MFQIFTISIFTFAISMLQIIFTQGLYQSSSNKFTLMIYVFNILAGKIFVIGIGIGNIWFERWKYNFSLEEAPPVLQFCCETQ